MRPRLRKRKKATAAHTRVRQPDSERKEGQRAVFRQRPPQTVDLEEKLTEAEHRGQQRAERRESVHSREYGILPRQAVRQKYAEAYADGSAEEGDMRRAEFHKIQQVRKRFDPVIFEIQLLREHGITNPA